jgi:hypothetical protein
MGSLHHLNGGATQVLTCHHCTSVLEDERAVANTPAGPRYFCKADPEHPLSTAATSSIEGGSIEQTCYCGKNQWGLCVY